MSAFRTLTLIVSVWATAPPCVRSESTSARARSRPNVLVLIADDLGIGDLGCYGNTSFATPHIDRLAREGAQLRHHVTAATVCSPSRAALLTGRYPVRLGMQEARQGPPVVIHPFGRAGLPPNETTFARALRDAGYETQLVGKWHQGWSCETWDDQCHGPLQHGFQSFLGLPFSLLADTVPDPELRRQRSVPFLEHVLPRVLEQASDATALWRLWLDMVRESYYVADVAGNRREWSRVSNQLARFLQHMLVRDREPVSWPYQHIGLTQRLVHESVDFITRQRHAPFLLVHSFLHVHTPMFTTPELVGASGHSRYADNVLEMDWGVGELLQALERAEVADNTIVHFVSDHGGEIEAVGTDGQRAGGFNGPFSGGKGQGGMEGGLRVPALLRWPGVTRPGSHVDVPTSTLDLLPTLLEATGVSVDGLTLDGRSLLSLLRGAQPTVSHHQFLFHYCGSDVHAVRYVPESETAVYKLHLKQPNYVPGTQRCSGSLCSCSGENVVTLDPPRLYDVTADPAEAAPIAAESALYRHTAALMLEALRRHLSTTPAVPAQLDDYELVAPQPQLVPWDHLHRFRGVQYNMSGLDDWHLYLNDACSAGQMDLCQI